MGLGLPLSMEVETPNPSGSPRQAMEKQTMQNQDRSPPLLLVTGATLKSSIRWLIVHLDYLYIAILSEKYSAQCTIHQVENGEYVYTVTIDGVVEHSVKNSDPEEFSDVSVYASDPWNLHQPSHIRALTIQTIIVMESLFFYTFTSFLLQD